MLRILVSNDDGIDAHGIRTLVRFLSHMAEVYVVAPDKQRSGSGQAITFGGKVTAKQVEMDGAKKAIALSGTPADCAKFGIDMMREAATRLCHRRNQSRRKCWCRYKLFRNVCDCKRRRYERV